MIQNATVTATGPSQTYKGVTGANGVFTIPFVQPAKYDVTISARGFQTEKRPGILIDINTKANLEVTLQVGAEAMTVVVQGTEGLTVNTEDASGGTIMDPEKVQQLPLNGRQSYMLLSLVPGTQFTQTQFGPSGYSGTRGWDETNSYAINGQSGSFNQFTLDGAPVSQQNGGGSGTWNIAPNIDAIQEFKVMTNTYDAQYGRYAGGTVNTILKSGTRQFHGTAFDFWRNSILDANRFEDNQVGNPRPFHNEHQYGGTVGGPIIPHKDKLFFFFSFEGWREVQPNDLIVSVPTADMFPDERGNVNLSGYQAAKGEGHIYDPATVHCAVEGQNPCELYERDPFPDDTIPASRINPVAVKIMNLYPKPNLSNDYFNNYSYRGSSRYKYNQPIGKADWTINDSTKLSGTFSWWSGTEYRNGNGYPGAATRGNINDYRSTLTQTLDLTHTFNPNLFGDIRISFNREFNQTHDGALSAGLADETASDLGLSMPQIPTTTHEYMPQVNVEKYGDMGGNTTGITFFETYVLQPSMSQVIGRHNLHYGFETMLFHDNVSSIGAPNGVFQFGTGYTWQYPNYGNSTGGSVPDLYLGYPDSGRVEDHTSTYISYKEYGAYFQDNWKVTPKLALNFGLRWDTETSPTERNHHLAAGICLTCVNSISTALGRTIYGTAQFETSSLTPYENTKGNLQPKFGASYTITNKLVVRGGYGLGTALGIELGGASPWNQNTNYNARLNDATWEPSEDFNSGTPFPNGYIPAAGSSLGDLTYVGNTLGIDLRDRKIPLIHSFSFGVQTELPMNILVDVEYVGALTSRIRSSRQYNGLSDADVAKGLQNSSYLDDPVANPFYGVLPKTVSLGNNPTIPAKRLMVPYPQFNGDFYIYTHADGYQNYNSMFAKAEKRMSNSTSFSKGLSFLASFTWAKKMVANGYLNNTASFKVDDKPVYHWDGGNSAPTWAFSFSGLYGLPFGRGAWLGSNVNGFVDKFIGGWNLDWIFQNRAGDAFGIPNDRPFGCGQYDVKPAHRSYSSWVNNSLGSSCWLKQPTYFIKTYDGTTPKVRQPWAQQTALGMMKKFPLTERLNLQFKAEAFNATNTPQFGHADGGSPQNLPQRNLSVKNEKEPGAYRGYGTVGSQQQNFPRQFQLSLKLEF